MNKDNRHYKINLTLLVIVLILFYTKLDKIVQANPTNQATISTNNKNNKSIKLVKCTDGDTAEFSVLGKTRFLLIDTPESAGKYKKKPQYKGKEASKYNCDMLKNAKKITYEFDGNPKDKYGRSLAYIFVDGKLLQELIAKQGYVKKFYIYKSHYKYEARIRSALNDKYGIWQEK